MILLPKPKKCKMRDGKYSLSAEQLQWAADTASKKLCPSIEVDLDSSAGSHAEGYHLQVMPDSIKVQARRPVGAFYASMTLRQLVRQYRTQEKLPCVEIEDNPDFPHRGVSLDISRNRVPTMETLYMLIDMFAELKINQFQLYTEHTFAYRNHEVVWKDASPMTAEEIRALDAYCQDHFIELIPNQNSFGHLKPWLIHPEYKEIAEAPEGCDTVWGWQDGPFSLCPTEPGSIQLLEELYKELLPNFSSETFNVGCDETVDLGKVKSKAHCEEKGVGPVYLEFLLKIYDQVKGHGKTMMFWADVMNNHPELVPQLPKDVIALEWDYEAEPLFDKNCQKYKESNIKFYVCAGTSTWNSIGGRTDNALGNLRSAARSGLAHGAIGYLNTDWGDNGHWQHPSISFLPLAYGAAQSWASEENKELDIKEALNVHVFKDKAGIMGPLAYDLGNAYKEFKVTPFNASSLFNLLFYYDNPISNDEGRLKDISEEEIKKAAEYIERLTAGLSKAKMDRPDADLIIREFENAVGLLLHVCRLGQARFQHEGHKDIAHIDSATREELADELDPLLADYKSVWRSRSREGELGQSIQPLEKLLALYQGSPSIKETN
ncbi:MAG: family 20 glycosylhydrolase [Kiritimatiellae bacterium]|nr:family 20 glycosylhydrolase [Kiritimatiellia bacterium]NKB22802.1 family 20 glycosylhydrolase [Kiritimatiellia bacterium]NKB22811.1 family 20 glycosylhydrolase [Kiritimatiellia bacterium]NKB25958.1 family 20 glycosylhydrolase [Kiritimatiellia bacterium]NKB25967.1 family 20 glycosylhydrolase [Kiritimatiellia bacterium]